MATPSKIALIAALVLLAGRAMAQGSMADMPTHEAGSSTTQSMTTMERAMAAVPITGDADRDFVAMMIPHHQGAIDMARSELAHGKDPALRRMARDIIAAQDREIAQMRRWQAAHPAKAGPSAPRDVAR